ncbi:MAG: hypothetical protein U1E15_12925 [Hyphomicrobiales bacterium]
MSGNRETWRMPHKKNIRSALTLISALVVFAGGALADNIAGVAPSQRPAWAPVVQEFKKDNAWYLAALKGVEAPYAPSLRFLDDQGAWFTPFIHRGMHSPYDPRGLHANDPVTPQ